MKWHCRSSAGTHKAAAVEILWKLTVPGNFLKNHGKRRSTEKWQISRKKLVATCFVKHWTQVINPSKHIAFTLSSWEGCMQVKNSIYTWSFLCNWLWISSLYCMQVDCSSMFHIIYEFCTNPSPVSLCIFHGKDLCTTHTVWRGISSYESHYTHCNSKSILICCIGTC